jgi:hypothetical protein
VAFTGLDIAPAFAPRFWNLVLDQQQSPFNKEMKPCHCPHFLITEKPAQHTHGEPED